MLATGETTLIVQSEWFGNEKTRAATKRDAIARRRCRESSPLLTIHQRLCLRRQRDDKREGTRPPPPLSTRARPHRLPTTRRRLTRASSPLLRRVKSSCALRHKICPVCGWLSSDREQQLRSQFVQQLKCLRCGDEIADESSSSNGRVDALAAVARQPARRVIGVFCLSSPPPPYSSLSSTNARAPLMRHTHTRSYRPSAGL